VGGRGGSSWGSRGHPDRDPDRLVTPSYFVLLHTGRRVGGGEYNFARGVEFPFVPSPFLPASASSLSIPFFVFGVCTLGIENTFTQEERKTRCQIELTKQGGQDRICEIESDENIDKKSKRKTQASSRKSIDRDVVDKRQDTDKEEREKDGKNKAAKSQKIKK
jgi:hypothetical protein